MDDVRLTSHAYTPGVVMFTCAHARPTADVVVSRLKLATAGANRPNDQPVATLVSNPGLLQPSGFVPTHTIWYGGPSDWPSQCV